MSSVISLLVIIQTMSVTASQESCHCSNGCSDFPNTACPTRSLGPVCKTPWFGSFCQMENIAFHKTATQSTTYNYLGHFHASYAVDGNTDTDFSHSSCSHTDEPVGGSASWQVLLGDHRVFNISRIRIYLRQDFLIHNKNMQVFVSGYLCNTASGTTLDGTRGPVTNPFDVTCRHVTKGNKVTIKMSGPYLTLCEVQVFVCSDGWFGSDCNKQCQCLDPSEVCDKETGYCRSGCAAGKQGPGCQQVCSDGRFAIGCNKRCQCLDPSEVCDKETGNCRSGCAAGKQGKGCQQDCDDGQYGVNCSYMCGQCSGSSDCQKVDGTCTQGCQHDFNPPLCKACVQGKYSVNCSATCGHCKDGPGCDRSTGHCERGCLPGYVSPLCVDECGDYTYGLNCLNQCEVCDKVTGECGTGYQTTPPPTTTLATGTEHSQDIRLIAACCVMALLFVYSAVTTTLVVRLKRGQALIKAELEKQYISLETPAESPIYDVIAGTHTYNNDVQSGDSDYENINTHGATSL
ncbi:multiple epidermal growth factor-like domains protein 6 isoform X2 [Haliotis rubra]|uniref:multiple epidermal growth factor-like domains protein 6 isoform X2 n=1 Tax=Haliotis rubra TaxID=36100 RepID=UPI001EE62A0B|nr:multiple epidermal growth factor-like domains protein 6 isoform X2 [Haliotis rubra]